MTPEEAFLESLWAEEEGSEQRPILFESQVIQQASARPTYREFANNHQLISTTKPRNGDLTGSPGGTRLMPLQRTGADPEQQLDAVVQRIEAKQHAHGKCMLEVRKASELVQSMETELRSLREEEQELEAQQPPAKERLAKVQRWISERSMALQVQQELVESKQLELIAIEAGLRAAETELDFMADAKEELEQTRVQEASAREVTAEALRGWETRTAQSAISKMEKEAAKLEELEQEFEEQRSKVISAAEDAQEAARERLKKGLERVRRNREKGAAVVAAGNEERRQAVLSLKNSLAAVREEVALKADLYRQTQKQKKEMHEKEFQDLLEQGLNPYEVHRRRDMKKGAAKQRQQLRDNIQDRQLAIAEALAREEEAHGRALAAKEKERFAQEAFQKEMGVAARESRIDKYMLSRTNAHVPMLDPTGHLDPDPSAVTNFKTKNFGTGRADPELLKKLQDKHRDVGPNELLIPTKYRHEAPRMVRTLSSRKSYDDLDEAALGSSAAGDSPPASPPPLPQGWKVLETRPLTKLEQDAMDKAKERHRATIGLPREMMGRKFAGDAFMSTPAVVEFKDFEVGQTYSQKVVITNRSYEKNTYRVLQVPPEHCNVLEVSYKLPGYLATGVSGELTLTFAPKANEDIETALEMLADTGPFMVPVRCLTKKAKLVLSSNVVDFGPGLTLGENASRTFTITNEGALDVEFVAQVVAAPPGVAWPELPHAHGTHDADAQSEGDAPASKVSVSESGSGDGIAAAAAATTGMACWRPGVGPGPDGKIRAGPFVVHQGSGTVAGYGSTTISCTYTPRSVGLSTMALSFTFRAPAQRRLMVAPLAVSLRGIGREVPIFLENSVLDFKCSMFDHVYRDYLQVRNGGKTAMKVMVVKRPDVSDYFQFSPDFGFAQAGNVFPITVLFKPRASMLQQCARFLVDPENNIFEIPMKLNVPDQKLPVSFTLRAQVTTSNLVFDPPSIAFGPCVLNEDTAVPLRITNPSALPQTFGFIDTTPGISIKPNDGFGYILPGETLERLVCFQPSIAGPQNLSITARTLSGGTFTLPCTAVGVQPEISLSHNTIKFPATPVKDMTMVSLILTNNTDKSQAFEFGVPHGSDLTFIPNVGEIPAQSRFRVQVEFSPQPDPELRASLMRREHEAESEQAQASPQRHGLHMHDAFKGSRKVAGMAKVQEATEEGEDEAEDEEEHEEGPDPNSWYRWHEWHVTCCIRPPDKGRRPSSSASEHHHLHGPDPELEEPGYRQLHLAVETCAVQPDIILKTELPEIPDKPMYELNFGPVPVGQRITRFIELYNQGETDAPLRWDPLDAAQVFGAVNTHRSIPSGGTFRALLSFQPQQRTQYMEILTYYGMRTRVRIALKGLGIAPELRVDPPTALTSGFDMGDVYRGESAEQKFTVTNVCPFPLTFSLKFGDVPDPNMQMKPPFYARPAEGTLAQGESAEVTLVFQPSNQRPYFEDVMQVYVPNQQEELLVPIRARCWDEGVFVLGPKYPPPVEDPFMERELVVAAERAKALAVAAPAAASGRAPSARATTPPVGTKPSPAPSAAIEGASGIGASGLGGVPPGPRQLVLNFPHAMYLNETATASFEVGSLKSTTLGGAAGEVVLDDIPSTAKEAGWSIDPTRIPLAIGEKKPVQVRYTSPADVHAGMAAYFGHQEHMELHLGATLKGGLPAPPSPEGRRVELVFRVLLKPGRRPQGEDMPPSVTEAVAPADAAGKKGKK